MGGTPHLLEFDQAYETTPKFGPSKCVLIYFRSRDTDACLVHRLRFPLERYLPPANCIDIDDYVKYQTTFALMGRKSSNKDWCFRCGRRASQHPRGYCPCQWCSGAVDNGHDERVSLFQESSKLVLTIIAGVPMDLCHSEHLEGQACPSGSVNRTYQK